MKRRMSNMEKPSRMKRFGNEIVRITKNAGRGVKKLDTTQWIILFFLTLLTVFMLLPIVYIFNHAFKPLHELFLFPPTFIVRAPTIQNFVELMSMTESTFVPVSRYIFISVVVTVLTRSEERRVGSVSSSLMLRVRLRYTG